MSMPSQQNQPAGQLSGDSIEKCVKPISGMRPSIAAKRQQTVAAPAHWMWVWEVVMCPA